MDNLTPEQLEIIEAARFAHDPTPEDRARVRKALFSAVIGAGAVGGGISAKALIGTSLPAVAKTAVGGSFSYTMKVIGIASLAAALGGYATVKMWPATRSAEKAPAAAAKAVSSPASEIGSRQIASTANGASQAVEIPAPADHSAAGTSRVTSGRIERQTYKLPLFVNRKTEQAASAVGQTQAAAESEKTVISNAAPALAAPIAEEIALIGEASRALRDGRAADAIDKLEEHERRFAQGALAEERRGLRVLALCGLGRREQAMRERKAFLLEAPVLRWRRGLVAPAPNRSQKPVKREVRDEHLI